MISDGGGLLVMKRIVSPCDRRVVAVGRLVRLLKVCWTLLRFEALGLLQVWFSMALVFGLVVRGMNWAFRWPLVASLASNLVSLCMLVRAQVVFVFRSRSLTVLCVRPLPRFSCCLGCSCIKGEPGLWSSIRLRQASTTRRALVVNSRLVKCLPRRGWTVLLIKVVVTSRWGRPGVVASKRLV